MLATSWPVVIHPRNESTPVGNLHFAGEHCSLDFQGDMNGAAQSGRDVALDVLKKLGKAAPALG